MTAALAAAAGAVGFSHSSLASPTPANSAVNMAALNATMGDSRLSAITTARIERRQLAARDSSRVELAPTPARKRQALAARTAKARAAKLDTYRRQALHQANVLAALKAKRLKEQAENRVVSPLAEYRITARFGQAGSRWARNHTGLDMAAPIGTRIGAAMRGTVTSVEYAGHFGRRVIVTHEDGTETWYCHMSEFTVEVGDTVYAGDQVGSVGMTGNTSGPHLHFEVHPDGGEAVDPVAWFRDHGRSVL
jgi:murein DD-endopeptidase MepM/ murein hydrolase activator NlpD